MRLSARALFLAVTLASGSAGVLAQRPTPQQVVASPQTAIYVLRSSAWAEITLRRSELSAELESLLAEYTEDYPKIREIKYSLNSIDDEKKRLLAIKASEADRLTAALGKLVVRKVELQTELWKLLQTYKDEHPEVKRAKKKVEVFEAAIKEILN